MTVYSKFLALVSGIPSQIDLSSNTLNVGALEVGGILLSSTTGGSAGSTLIGDDASYSNFTPTAATVKGALSGIDAALASSSTPTPTNAEVVWVSKAGNDSTGNGSFSKPFLTIGHAFTSITDASSSKPYVIRVQPGVYSTTNLRFKSWVWLVGESTDSTIVTDTSGTVQLDATSMSSGTQKIGVENINFASTTLSLDLQTIGGTGDTTVTLRNLIVGAASTFNGRAGADNLNINDTIFGDSFTNNGMNLNAYNVFFNQNAGTSTFDNAGASSDSTSYILGSVFNGAITFGAVTGTSQSTIVTYGCVVNSGSTINGTHVLVVADASFQGGALTLTNGATDASNFFRADSGFSVSYSPGIGSDWNTSPTYVSGALDTLATSGIVKSQTQNKVLASPNGSSGLPSFRALVAADIPSLSYLPLAGGTMTGNIAMSGNKLTGLGAGTTAGDSVRYEQAILTSGANAFAANQSMGGNKLTNLADPTAGTDAVNLNYLSARLAGLKPKQAVRAATTTAGTLATSFANGSVIDGVTLATGDRILIKDQSSAAENGIYTVNASGSPTRATDFDSVSPIDEINGAWVSVQEGTANAGKVYVQFGTVTTIGTDAINFEYFNPIASLIGGDMITFSGSTFSVDLATASGLESTNPGNAAGQLRIKLEASNPSLKFTGSNELAVKLDPAGTITSGASGLIVGVDNSTIEINSNALRVKDAGITLAKLASNSVDENKIVSTALLSTGALNGGSGTKLSVNVDGSSIEISSNALRIKTTAYDQATITGGGGSAAAVQNAPKMLTSQTAGESFAANTSFLVRWAVNGNGDTTDRVYKADNSSASPTTYNYYAIGVAVAGAGVSAGGTLSVVSKGSLTLGSSDSNFASGDIGKPVYLTTTGGFSTTAPSASGTAVLRIGFVESTTKLWVDPQFMGIN